MLSGLQGGTWIILRLNPFLFRALIETKPYESRALQFIAACYYLSTRNKGNIMDDFTCSELLEELLVRFQQTNGIEFCSPETLGKVAGYILAQENVWEAAPLTDDELFG